MRGHGRARPELAEDGLAATGSMHIVDLPDGDAARVFAYDEPNYKGGVYSEVMTRRWRNALGRTMWALPADPDASRFLAIGHGTPDRPVIPVELHEAHRDFMVEAGYRDRVIVGGPLLSDDGTQRVGTALTIELPSRAAVELMLANDPYAGAGHYERVEIHRWQLGGRR